MISCLTLDVLVVALSLALYMVLSSGSGRDKQHPLPPGPFRWPILGNALDMPKEKEWIKFAEWKKKYGDITYVSVFGRSIAILNSAEAALDLLDKRSSIYSDRPHMTMAGELIGWDKTLGLLRYDERFRQTRKLMHRILSPRPVQIFRPLQEQETARFLGRLLETPDNFIDHIRHTAAAIILKISHGYEVSESEEDPLVKLVETAMDQFSQAVTSGAYLVDLLPWLKYLPSWLPGTEFRRTAVKWRKDLFRMLNEPHEFAKAQIAKGVAVPSFTSEAIEEFSSEDTESIVKWGAQALYGGGADTTVSSVTSFFLAMCTHPRVQATAQAELDAVIGNDRLPTVADRDRLPYIDAIVKEIFRWGPIAPLAIPHRLVQEDSYKGYRLPVGTLVVPNIWAMLHDPEVFPNPFEFRPERFLGPGKVEGAAADPLQLAFGFGRRVCPGQHLAEPSVFLSVSMTLATFHISKARDGLGNVIEPEREWSHGVISHPKPFKCLIEPRSTRAAELIRQSIAAEQKS